MTRWFVAILLVLTATSAMAQSPIELSISPVFTRQTVNLHEDQWENTTNQTRLKIRAATFLGNQLRVKYAMVTNFQDAPLLSTFSPLTVGEHSFGTKNSTSGISDSQKATSLELSTRPQHRVEAVWLGYPLNPVLSVAWAGHTLSATGEIDGKTVNAQEQFSGTFVAAGAQYRLVGERAATELRFVLGKDSHRFDVSAEYRLSPVGFLHAGWFIEEMRFDGLRAKQSGYWIGLMGVF